MNTVKTRKETEPEVRYFYENQDGEVYECFFDKPKKRVNASWIREMAKIEERNALCIVISYAQVQRTLENNENTIFRAQIDWLKRLKIID
ncbi:hypothetical protein PP175_29385 (plasmid) [Aneurinibacillus sp. Ricciae_BoGa-3]|uniref:hypothetical protein n=1 Tax=Aneurinibacillus sp. Ricciae_BoGa-3 TaxID=3022697 RepID=UPI002340DE03|nr:hypothetical protein [Aneurinibacillus sp. Ricciae_BoGa-3]WCK57305.1 hypothetical protein PP175_29385 [Aneurinibacillus sp. Ricciae_BoGa-3]